MWVKSILMVHQYPDDFRNQFLVIATIQVCDITPKIISIKVMCLCVQWLADALLRDQRGLFLLQFGDPGVPPKPDPEERSKEHGKSVCRAQKEQTA